MKRGMKIVLSATMLMVLILGLQACGGTKAKDIAEQAVNVQIDAVKNYPDGNLGAFYQLLSTEDKDLITEENFKERYKLPTDLQEIIDLFPEATQVFKASGFKESVTDSRATVVYTIELPDPDQIGQNALSLSDLLLISGEKVTSLSDLPEEVKTKLKAHVEKNGIPIKAVSQTMNLVREDDEWRVHLNLEDNLPAGRIPTPFTLNNM